MRRTWPFLLALLAAWPAAGAEDEADAVAKLPACLHRGAKAQYERAAGFGRLKADVTFRVAEGELKDAVVLVLETKTAEVGPLTKAKRLHAVFDAKRKRIESFTWEVAEGVDAEYRLVSDFGPDPEKEDRLVFRKYDVGSDGERRERKTRVKPPDSLWTPEPLEPFLAALLAPTEETPAAIGIMDVETGRFSRSSPEYRALGDGKMKIGDEDVACRIWRRERGETQATVYRRSEDGMPVKDDAAHLVLVPEKEEGR